MALYPDLGLQLSGMEEGRRGFGLDVTILKKGGAALYGDLGLQRSGEE